jgi:hypothetical protein
LEHVATLRFGYILEDGKTVDERFKRGSCSVAGTRGEHEPAELGGNYMKRIFMAALAAGLALSLTTGAGAADITLLYSNALKTVVDELHPQFEKATGHKLVIVYNATGPIKAEIGAGIRRGDPRLRGD